MLKPKTEVVSVFEYLDQVDMVPVMTVEPGFGGQSFMAEMLPEVEKLPLEHKREANPKNALEKGGDGRGGHGRFKANNPAKGKTQISPDPKIFYDFIPTNSSSYLTKVLIKLLYISYGTFCLISLHSGYLYSIIT